MTLRARCWSRMDGNRKTFQAATASAVAVLAWAALFLGGRTIEWLYLAAALLAASIAFWIASRVDSGSGHPDIAVREYGSSAINRIFAHLEARVALVKKLRIFNMRLLLSIVQRTGASHDVEKSSTTASRAAVLLMMPSLPLGIWCAQYSLPLAAICAAPIPAYFWRYVSLRLQIIERKSKTEEETAYFLCYVHVLQSIGHDLYHAYESLSDGRMFPAMARDAKEICKRVRVLGITKSESLSMYARNHPLEKFRDFVEGYLAKATQVGSVPLYTEEKARYFFAEYQAAWKRYEKSAQDIFSGIMMVSIILPLMIMLSSMIGNSETSSMLAMIGSMLSPLMAVIMTAVLGSIQPAAGDPVRVSVLGPASGAAAFAASYAAGLGLAQVIATSFLAGAAVNAVLVRPQLAAVRNLDRMIPEFMRDVTELSRTGMGIAQIISSRRHRGALGRLLQQASSKMQMGRSLDSAMLDIGSTSPDTRFVMFLLERIRRSGSNSAAILNMITEFTLMVRQTKESVAKSLASLNVIVYAAPFIILGIAHVMTGIFAAGEADAIPGMSMQAQTGQMTSLEIMTALIAIPLGSLAAKASSYTVRDTTPLAITSASTLLAVYLTPAIAAAFSG